MTYPLFARLVEFIISKSNQVDLEVADKLYQFHIIPMQKVREELGVWITASENSGYRPQWWERLKKRSGKSQHTYNDEWKKGSGAVDWTCKDFAINKDKFLKLIIEHTNYTRICMYETFIHCDFKETSTSKRQLFYIDGNGEWEFYKNLTK